MAEKKTVDVTEKAEKSNKKKRDIVIMLKEAAVLFVITLIAGVVLGYVYELTKEPIRLQQEKAIQEACAAVFPEAEAGMQFEASAYVPGQALTEELLENGVEIGTVYEAEDADGALCGYVVESTTSQGYGGNIVLYVGVNAEGLLSGVSILEIAETPGLGMRAEEVLLPQFGGKRVPAFTYTKTGSQADSEIDAISGATVTTKAVVNAVNGGLRIATELLEGGGANE